MSLFGGLAKLVKPLAKVASNPLLSKVGGMIPGVGTVIGAVGTAATVYGAVNSMRGGSSSAPSGGLPPLPAPGTTSGPGVLPRGPGGALQMPWNDPNAGAAKPWALDDAYLKPMFRAPKGYVVMWDGGRRGVGRPFPVLKSAAMKLHYADGSKVYHHHAKPPISVGDYHALKRAHKTIKKVHKIHGLISYVNNNTTEAGKVKVHRHHKKGGHK